MDKIALLLNRSYIDSQPCFMELAIQLSKSGYAVDLYMVINPYNLQPFFTDHNIQVLPFPVSKFQKAEFWYKINFSRERKYKALIATPIEGAWLAYKISKIQKIPFYYFADELEEYLITNSPAGIRKKLAKKNYIANKKATGTIALGVERYLIQKELNKIDYPHDYFIIPNAPAGNTKRLKSNYFRDIFNIEDRKPILLFAGTLNWSLAKKIYEETKTYSNKDYHLIFQTRTLGLMGNNNHPFIKISTIPIPSILLNYAISSADIGLALYDKSILVETRNGFTGGKIGTYLKNELPIITGSADNLRFFEEEQVGVYWDGEISFDEIANKAIVGMETYRKNIPDFYTKNLQYEIFFKEFKDHIMKSIEKSSI